MATWHQQRRPVRLWHDTKYSVVCDPPGEFRSVSLQDTRVAAERFMDILARNYPHNARYTYIIPPKR